MIAKYRAETLDIEDVEWEEPDLEFWELFPLGKSGEVRVRLPMLLKLTQ